VEFNPKQDDLYFDVTCGGQYANSLYKITSTVDKFNEKNAGKKTVLAAINGDMWLMTSTHSRVEGMGTSYMGYDDPVVTKGLTIPRGFSMYDGEIICSTNMEQETPYNGTFQSFGITSDGEALLGNIECDVTILNRSTMNKVKADGINRLPADNALVLYTDKGYASNYALSDAYEVIIDCDYDYVLRAGTAASVNGTVTAITKTGEEKMPMQENRIILTARGDRISRISSLKAGDKVSISTKITDTMGNTEKWCTVTNCVGGHMPIVIDGVSQGLSDSTCYPCSVLGIKSDGTVVMLTSYGRQGKDGYSYGFRICDLDDICNDLGIKTAFLLDGGGSAEMVVQNDSSYEITGRPSDGKERGVVNSVILSVGKSRSGAEAPEFVFDSEAKENILYSTCGVSAKLTGYSLRLLSTGELDPNIEFSCLGTNTDNCKYLTVTAMANSVQTAKIGLFFAVGDSYTSTYNRYKQVEFDSTGEWQTLVIKMSDIDAWYGRIYKMKIVLFENGVPVANKGIAIHSIRMHDSLSSALTAAEQPKLIGDLVAGDVNSDGVFNAKDISLLMKYYAGMNTEFVDRFVSDYDADGFRINKDVSAMIKALV